MNIHIHCISMLNNRFNNEYKTFKIAKKKNKNK